eukprot:948373-Amphidinium_carterae.1
MPPRGSRGGRARRTHTPGPAPFVANAMDNLNYNAWGNWQAAQPAQAQAGPPVGAGGAVDGRRGSG